jgi:sulfate transport system ATP-binding protein
MDKGKIEQIGTPGDVYDNPATAFVHGFIGESIVLPVQVSDGKVRLGGRPLNLANGDAVSGPSNLFIRRHDVRSSRQAGRWKARQACACVRPDPACGRGAA